jgi:hypothetical protein
MNPAAPFAGESMTFVQGLALAQAIYFGLTGLWPIVHIRSFMAVTGPKHDLWLVRTVGVLITAIAVPIGMAGWRGTITPEIGILAIGRAAGLAAIDVIYVLRRVIARIYLVDAAVELLIIAGWCGAR